ncbi:Metallo-dependent phosphatase-like protein [Xylariaceae sp. FL0016]|nr:Metallo-dependent phosphatase-like protein [Xylariaceae sp. FL0016]
MKLRKPFQWTALVSVVTCAPTTTDQQHVLQPGATDTLQYQSQSLRKLHGRFLHITDLHPDEFYKPHTSTEEGIACHRSNGPAGTYGAETSDCDSPMKLVNATLDWVRDNLKDSIDFVVWTGDSARHDSDEDVPRHNRDILSMNRRIANAFVDTFSDDKGLEVPVVPTFGNNDIYPHNILMPGPNTILKTYSDIWKTFIPNEQRHTFEFGGWFYVEVIPGKLAVFSLNTMYFFDRNAGVDDCVHPSEPGYKHFEWLRIQLDFLRKRGVKAIMMGHVPPARTSGKQLWDETCWQKYTLWLKQYRDVIVGSLYGHMNIDHFLLQDSKDIDMAMIKGLKAKDNPARESMDEEEMSIESSANYLMELRDDWAKLPSPSISKKDVEGLSKKKHKKGKNKMGPLAERYQLSLISPSVVPNYFPTLRVIEYNITGLESSSTWVDALRAMDVDYPMPESDLAVNEHSLELRSEPDLTVDKKKGKKGKKPKDPNLHIPDPPAKDSTPGPAYLPQPLTFLGFTQYYANLTYINNDIEDESFQDDGASSSKWEPGKHKDKTPKHAKPQPKKFTYEVEYSTFDDKIYKLQDLTVKSFVKLARRIGKASSKSKAQIELENDFEEEEPIPTDLDMLLDDEDQDDDDDDDDLENEMEDDSGQEDGDESDDDIEVEGKKKKKKGKGGKKKKAKKVWLHFLKHAFVSTKSKKELKHIE